MKERSISFTTRLIPGLLDGSITQTRRTRGLEEINKDPDIYTFGGRNSFGEFILDFEELDGGKSCKFIKCPYGEVGDRLWVRETWAIAAETPNEVVDVMYKADEGTERFDMKHIIWFDGLKLPKNCDIWHSGRFMPRWASRILLEITAIRVERLQEIKKSFIDLKAEGIPDDILLPYMANDFSILWDFLNAKRGYPWAMNPWPWVLGLRRVDVE